MRGGACKKRIKEKADIRIEIRRSRRSAGGRTIDPMPAGLAERGPMLHLNKRVGIEE